jgi:hypothetical protein
VIKGDRVSSSWGAVRRLLEAAVTLGGSENLRSALQQMESEESLYDAILREASSLSERLQTDLAHLGSRMRSALRKLRSAQTILAPAGRRRRTDLSPIEQGRLIAQLTRIEQSSIAIREFTALEGVAQGSVAGGTVGLGSWAAVSLLGTASTGIGIGTLYGAAATNATLAWFGGGSLATGGLGMAGGTLALGGLVLVPMLGIASWWTHSKAMQVRRRIADLRRANERNSDAVSMLRSRILKVAQVLPPFERSVESLNGELKRVNQSLFPFWWLSRIRRFMSSRLGGGYYNDSELALIDSLSGSVDSFIRQFKENKNIVDHG